MDARARPSAYRAGGSFDGQELGSLDRRGSTFGREFHRCLHGRLQCLWRWVDGAMLDGAALEGRC
jgi:hypothetical protein